MCDSYNVSPGNEAISKRPKQTLVLLTILALTLVTATSNGLYRATRYREFLAPLAAPGVILMLILTEWKGRKVLFKTLFVLSLLSSLVYLSEYEYFEYPALCLILHSPVQGSAIALLYIVISEYCDPERRFFYLIVNSAIQMLFHWITLALQFNVYHLKFFGDWMQYVNVILGIFGLWSIFKWPESPYWLSSKGRFQESAKAFVELRGVSESEEFRVLTDSKRRPGSFKMFVAPILISIPIFFMIMTYTTAPFELYDYEFMKITSETQQTVKAYGMLIGSKCVASILSVLTALSPVHMPRKVLYLLSCGFYVLVDLFFLFAVAPAILIHVLETIVDYGPMIVSLPLLIEIIPQKFVSSVTVSVSVLYVIMQYFFNTSDMTYLTEANVIVLVLAIIGYFVMPETHEKTLIEIEQLYVSKKDKRAEAIQTDL